MAGRIHPDAQRYLSTRTPRERKILEPFLAAGFDVTWAQARRMHNTDVSLHFLKASSDLSESYSLEYEIVLAYSHYQIIEPRTLRAVESLISTDPAKGRVESMWYFLISESNDVTNWVTSYMQEQKESLIVVPFSAEELLDPTHDAWLLRNRLNEHFYALDRYKYTLPLEHDTYFFGRNTEVGKLLDLMRRGENAGLFGLRKTGKTSTIFKLRRLVEYDGTVRVLVIDAQSPSVQERRWNELLEYIANKLLEGDSSYDCGAFETKSCAEDFEAVLEHVVRRNGLRRLIIAIDEIEWISPETCKSQHWNEEFLPFWQVIRSCQTKHRNLAILVAGLNPAMVERDRFGSFQNPLFGIVTPVFLGGLKQSESCDMVEKIGKIMGLKFAEDALGYLYDQYCGHPLLTRLACSHVAELAKVRKLKFPISSSKNQLIDDSVIRDSELVFYVRHVVSELASFYPEEYTLLEQLANNDIEAFTKTSLQANASHLLKYGLVSSGAYPFITYNVIRQYVAAEANKRDGKSLRWAVVEIDARADFVSMRIRRIIEDFRTFERLIKQSNLPLLFGANSFPEADKLIELLPPITESDLSQALSVLNRCFVESVEQYGQSINQRRYFWDAIKKSYPDVQEALHRVKVYRHNAHHLQLNTDTEAAYQRFLNIDIDDNAAISPDRSWILFQRTLDELLRSLQKEIARLSS